MNDRSDKVLSPSVWRHVCADSEVEQRCGLGVSSAALCSQRHAPAADRNREPILEKMRQFLPDRARVLEIGSGTGQHAAFFTSRTSWAWQPTDRDASAVASIEAYRLESQNSGFLAPLQLDVRGDAWQAGPFDCVFAANVIHISPWSVCLAILEGAARILVPSGTLVFYGPFRFNGEFTAESNAAFDARLRTDDPAWGVRDVSDIEAAARENGFTEPPRLVPMPANNHLLAFRAARLSSEP
jgi:SAM-dependent methyltransferase